MERLTAGIDAYDTAPAGSVDRNKACKRYEQYKNQWAELN